MDSSGDQSQAVKYSFYFLIFDAKFTHVEHLFSVGFRKFPPYRLSALVLLSRPKSEYLRSKAEVPDWFMTGTAVIVESFSKDILLTAGHCVYADENERYGKYEFACCQCVTNNVKDAKDDDTSTTKNDEDGKGGDIADFSFYEYHDLFPVEVVAAKDKPDIAVLRRVDGKQFDNADMIPLCPPESIPWLHNVRDWNAEVMCFHCPITKFETDHDYENLECCTSNWLQVVAESAHHFWLEENFREGSSGGAVVWGKSHTLLGILVHTVNYGEFELKQGRESVKISEELKKPQTSDVQNIEVVSLKGSVARSQCVSTVAVIPSLVQMTQNGTLCNLYQWLKS